MAGANAIKTSDATIQWGNVAGGIFTADTNLLIFASAVADTITIGGAFLRRCYYNGSDNG